MRFLVSKYLRNALAAGLLGKLSAPQNPSPNFRGGKGREGERKGWKKEESGWKGGEGREGKERGVEDHEREDRGGERERRREGEGKRESEKERGSEKGRGTHPPHHEILDPPLQTDGRAGTGRQQRPRLRIASRGKKSVNRLKWVKVNLNSLTQWPLQTCSRTQMSFCDIIMNTYRKFFNPKYPGITRTQSRDFGIGKIGRDPGIRDPGIAIPIP